MIPYFELRQIPIGGGRSLAAFGTLVGLGILGGAWFTERRARATGVPQGEVAGAILSAVVPGVLVAHLVAVVPQLGTARFGPRLLLEFWNGLDSFGGLAGAFLGLTVHYWRARRPWLPMADALVQGLVVGWVFGRLGCTLVHDHIGTRSDFPLAVAFPDGARHDLGLYELLYTLLVLVPAVLLLNRRPRPAGTSVAVLALLYAPARFLGDFLRQTDLPGADARLLGLTGAQYGCVVLAAVGVALALRHAARDNCCRASATSPIEQTATIEWSQGAQNFIIVGRSGAPPAQCPTNGPLANLLLDCSDYAYLYTAGSVVAALSSGGDVVAICMASTSSPDVLCFGGPVQSATTFALVAGSVNGGPLLPIGAGSAGNITGGGQTLNFTVILDGEVFPFIGFSYFDTEPLGEAAATPPAAALEGTRRAVAALAGTTAGAAATGDVTELQRRLDALRAALGR